MKRFSDRTRTNGGLFSDIFRATSATGAVVALKITDPDFERPPHNSEHEVRLLKALKPHAAPYHLVELLDSFCEGDDRVMVFPWLPYHLGDVVKHHSRASMPLAFYRADTLLEPMVPVRKNTMPGQRARAIVTTLLESLAFIHSHGIIHRDLKPANILFATLDAPPLLGDFGIAWKEEVNVREPPSEKICDVATGLYRAPELLFSVGSYTEKIDMWSLGVIVTLLYSTHCCPVFDDAANHSDLALMGSIFDTFGTDGLETWREVQDNQAFRAMSFGNKITKPLDVILPRLDDSKMGTIFTAMMVYQSTERLSAPEALALLAE